MSRIEDVTLGTWSHKSAVYVLPGKAVYGPSISDDGRWILYNVWDEKLHMGSIVRLDRLTGHKTQVASGKGWDQKDDPPSLSEDGRYVAFSKPSGRLNPDTHGEIDDIYRKDLLTGSITQVSISEEGWQSQYSSADPHISRNGRYVSYDTPGHLVSEIDNEVYRKDLVSGKLVQVSPREEADNHFSMSENGRYIAFPRSGTLMEPPMLVNVKDLNTGVVKATYVYKVEAPPNTDMRIQTVHSVTDNGRYIVMTLVDWAWGNATGATFDFHGSAYSELVRWDSTTGRVTKLSDGNAIAPPDGRYVASLSATAQENPDLVLTATDRATGSANTISLGSSSNVDMTIGSYSSSPLLRDISADGRFVAVELAYKDKSPEKSLIVDTQASLLNAAADAGRDLVLDLHLKGTSQLRVTWGDGSTTSLPVASSLNRLEHAYAADGTYAVRIKASGASGPATKAYTVTIDTTVEADQTEQTLVGSRGADIVLGSRVRDTILLGSGDDLARGGGGDDTLDGGAGRDILSGGAGHDSFVFSTRLNARSNVDRIVDFKHGTDLIVLDHAVFAALPRGDLAATAFAAGTAAHAHSQKILYDKATGILSYDPDGSGAKAAIAFAQVAKGLNLTHHDFLIV